jgi:hypothetical protein
MKYSKVIFLIIITSAELCALDFGGYEFDIGGTYNILQYRANVREEPNLNSAVIAILSLHDKVEILENTLIEEEINGFLAFWYRIKYGNIVGYTFGGNIAAQMLVTDIDKNGINDYFYIRCFQENYWHKRYPESKIALPYNCFIPNRDLIIYINNKRIGIKIWIPERHVSDGFLLEYDDHVVIELHTYYTNITSIDFYKVKNDGSIVKGKGWSYQGTISRRAEYIIYRGQIEFFPP